MSTEHTYIKLKELDGHVFTISMVLSYAYKCWDNDTNQMLSSDIPKKGYKKRWTIDTDRGIVEVSQAQMGKILEALYDKGKDTLSGKSLSVRSNGREGFQQDYWFNIPRDAPEPHIEHTPPKEEDTPW